MASASTSLVKRLVSVPDGARNAIKFQPDLGGPPVEQGIGEGSFFFFFSRTFLTAASCGVKRTGRSGLASSSGHRPRSRPALGWDGSGEKKIEK